MAKQSLQTENLVSVTYWRDLFFLHKKTIEAMNPKVSLHAALIQGDQYYDTAAGTTEYTNLIRGKAGIEKTVKAVKALERFLSLCEAPNTTNKHLKNIVLP